MYALKKTFNATMTCNQMPRIYNYGFRVRVDCVAFCVRTKDLLSLRLGLSVCMYAPYMFKLFVACCKLCHRNGYMHRVGNYMCARNLRWVMGLWKFPSVERRLNL